MGKIAKTFNEKTFFKTQKYLWTIQAYVSALVYFAGKSPENCEKIQMVCVKENNRLLNRKMYIQFQICFVLENCMNSYKISKN